MYKKVVVVTNKVPVLEISSPTKLLYSFEYFSSRRKLVLSLDWTG